MRAPAFWDAGVVSPWPALLTPLAVLYGAAGKLRRALANPLRLPIPVVCVGNLVAGGAGKTPAVIALVRHLKQKGRKPHVVTRGYGGRLVGPVVVDHAHSAADVGDEALLLAAETTVWVARDRAAGGQAAVAAGADCVVLDDGFQNPALHQDVRLLVIDQAFGLGNGRVIPAGPLREAPERGFPRAHGVIALRGEGERIRKLPVPAGLPVFTARLAPGIALADIAGARVVAFAGIGRPAKFFATLRAIGCDVVAEHAFPDHHAFDTDVVMRLVDEAKALKARLVTTAKDAVRLPESARTLIDVLPVHLLFDDPLAADRLLAAVLQDG